MNTDTHGSNQEEWIGFDLDGTLAKYDGWKGIEHIGAPVTSMVLVAKLLHKLGKKIKILTARVAPGDGNDEGDTDASKAKAYVEKWCEKNLGFIPEITYVKDASMVALFDDRAVAVEQNKGKVLGGWPDCLPKASDKAKKAILGMQKKAEAYKPSDEDLRRMYDIVQADAKLDGRIAGMGFGKGGDAYRKAALKLRIMELAEILKNGKRVRNRIVHAPGYVPPAHVADRTLQEYSKADESLSRYLKGFLRDQDMKERGHERKLLG